MYLVYGIDAVNTFLRNHKYITCDKALDRIDLVGFYMLCGTLDMESVWSSCFDADEIRTSISSNLNKATLRSDCPCVICFHTGVYGLSFISKDESFNTLYSLSHSMAFYRSLFPKGFETEINEFCNKCYSLYLDSRFGDLVDLVDVDVLADYLSKVDLTSAKNIFKTLGLVSESGDMLMASRRGKSYKSKIIESFATLQDFKNSNMRIEFIKALLGLKDGSCLYNNGFRGFEHLHRSLNVGFYYNRGDIAKIFKESKDFDLPKLFYDVFHVAEYFNDNEFDARSGISNFKKFDYDKLLSNNLRDFLQVVPNNIIGENSIYYVTLYDFGF